MTVKAVVENPAISQLASVTSAVRGRSLGSAVLLRKVSFWELLPYWHWAAYSGLLRRERIIIPQLTVSCSVHSVTELAGIMQILLKLCLRLSGMGL